MLIFVDFSTWLCRSVQHSELTRMCRSELKIIEQSRLWEVRKPLFFPVSFVNTSPLTPHVLLSFGDARRLQAGIHPHPEGANPAN